MTKLSASLPKGDKNGLAVIAPALVRRPTNSHVVLAVVTCSKVTTDYDSGDVVPTARVRRIEVLAPEDVPRAEQLMRRAIERRTGAVELPLDLEDELLALFGKLDPETGELLTDGEVFRSSLEDRRSAAGVDDDSADEDGDR